MPPSGSFAADVGTVDRIEGQCINLTESDPAAGGQHHYIDLGMVDEIKNGSVYLRTRPDGFGN